VRQLDWCNSVDWVCAGAHLAAAWSEEPSDGDDDGCEDKPNSEPGVGDDSRAQTQHPAPIPIKKKLIFSTNSRTRVARAINNRSRFEAAAPAEAVDARFSAFDFVALHHHGRGTGGDSGGCVAQYCGCCGS
jgi:hypothetical protein